MGGGSTLAAAQALGVEAIGMDLDSDYFEQAKIAIPRLSFLYPRLDGATLDSCEVNSEPLAGNVFVIE